MSQPEITLNSLFEEAYKLFESFDKRDDPTNSPEFQVIEVLLMRICKENAIRCSMFWLFHRNTKFKFEMFLIVGVCEEVHRHVRRLHPAGQHVRNV